MARWVDDDVLDRKSVMRVFPAKWTSDLGHEDVEWLCCYPENLKKAFRTRAVMGLSGWNAARCERYIRGSTPQKSKPETWRVAGTHRLFLFPFNKTTDDAPIGIFSFTPVLHARLVSGRVFEFWLNLELAWVAPKFRRKGYGTHLAAHLIQYFQEKPINSGQIDIGKGGVSVFVNAEVYSEGGMSLVQYVSSFFTLAEEETREAVRPSRRPWPVKNFSFEGGW